MYFNKKVVSDFVIQEQNSKHKEVADIIDIVIMEMIWDTLSEGFKIAELWWWAHVDRYERLFNCLSKYKESRVDWVDISPFMLEEAKTILKDTNLNSRIPLINFIESDIIDYLKSSSDSSIDLVIMKYTIDYIEDLGHFFELIQCKLKKWGVFVANIGVLTPELRSIRTSWRYLYNWHEFPVDETRTLNDWDTYSIKFFLVPWAPQSWYIEWWETTKYFHSEEKYRQSALKASLNINIWNWRNFIKNRYEIWWDENIILISK